MHKSLFGSRSTCIVKPTTSACEKHAMLLCSLCLFSIFLPFFFFTHVFTKKSIWLSTEILYVHLKYNNLHIFIKYIHVCIVSITFLEDFGYDEIMFCLLIHSAPQLCNSLFIILNLWILKNCEFILVSSNRCGMCFTSLAKHWVLYWRKI